ncbi:unnamed protein product [Periconia digitata]|uniref:Bromo domain-containing protein n=1 Tax=Periconia digitata TaxID=1303443 RepID=A0A9W4U634_9PLEO|nr:unnamed protein product [Periconia digitata]
MESAAKRKAASNAAGESEGRPLKRQKVPADGDGTEDAGTNETVESTTALGLRFLESLKNAKDKNGRPIATHFLTLPDKESIPEYYEVIKLPIALETIEGKLKRGEYSNLAQVESDQKRLVNNAKSYNDKKSVIFEDAERIRKTASNWMVKHNPAYRTHGYQAVPTPIPGEDPVPFGKPIPRVQPSTPRTAVKKTPDTSTDRPRRAAAAVASQSMTPAPSKLRQSASVVPADGPDDNQDFAGKSFQQAQEQIIRELMEYTDPDGLLIFSPFVNLPNRALRDYYQLIKEPVSLQRVHKRVRGIQGRGDPTDITEYKSWDAFAKIVSMIWKNARTYNEDGSELYNVSIELEEMFNKRLEEAKAKVPEPPQPKLKLNMSTAAAAPSTPTPTAAPKQQLKLKLRQSPVSDANTPRGRSSATPGFIVDNEALLRQQRHVMESMNGTRSSRPSSAGKSGTPVANPFNGAKGASSAASPLPITQTKTAASPPATNGIKRDVQSPALNAIRPGSNAPDGQVQRVNVPQQTPHGVLALPQGSSRPASGSPLPHTPYGQQASHLSQSQQPPTYYVPPVAPHFENFRSQPLKSVDEALIPKITLVTHPILGLPKPWSTAIPANKQKTSHSVTLMLPQAHNYLQVIPKVPIALTNRLYRIFVTVNGSKSMEVSRLPVTAGINGTMPNGYEGGKKKGEPAYDAKLMSGVNRIEIEIVAEKDRKGKPESKDPKEHVDVEKCTVFVHLMRS